jgi:hypothetical protein
MGFRLDRTYVLEFEGAMEGAYVKLGATPVGVTLELRGGESGSTSIERAAELLAEYVQEWNLDGRNGEPLPITTEAILNNLERVVVLKILVEWYKAAVGITAPLDPPGADGTLTDGDMPMEPIS